jgi:hypothetical protein
MKSRRRIVSRTGLRLAQPHYRSEMSALGQKQTFAPQKVMSALPPKAGIGAEKIDVC